MSVKKWCGNAILGMVEKIEQEMLYGIASSLEFESRDSMVEFRAFLHR